MANKYLVIGSIVGIIVLSLLIVFSFEFSKVDNNYALYESTYKNKTLQIFSVRIAEQYKSLQNGFSEPEIAACNYDLDIEYDCENL